MQPHNLTNENSSYIKGLIRRTHRNKMSTLCQSVDYHKIESCLLAVSGNPTMKSIEMTSHFDSGMCVVVVILPDVYVQLSLADILDIWPCS